MADIHGIEASLRELGEHIDWPAADLGGRVGREIRREASPLRRRSRWPAVVLAGLVALVLVSVVTPWGRRAVADLLGVAGIEISWGSLPSGMGAELMLGERMTLPEAVSRVDFPVLIPPGPDRSGVAAFVDDDPAGGRVDLVWGPASDLPPVGDTGVGMLHTQFRAELDRGLLGKRLGPGTEIRSTVVRGRAGFWIEGALHVLAFLDADGRMVEDTTRLAGNVLLWEEDGVTHRIEAAGDMERMAAIAENLVRYIP